MKKIVIFTFAFMVLVGCKKDPVPAPDGPAGDGGKTSSITFMTDREAGEQIVLGFDKEEFSKVEITGASESGYTTNGDYVAATYMIESKSVTLKGAYTYLDCHGIGITDLVLVGQTRLEILDCHDNDLTSLEVAGCESLESIACHDNPIIGETVTAFIESLPNRKSTKSGKLFIKGRPEARKVTKEDIALATSRNWQVLDSDGNQAVAIPDMSNVQPQDLGTVANCYMISKGGVYSFKPSMGKVDEWLFEDIASAELLWESYGTDEVITGGDLISHVSYENGRIIFVTAETFREGNAVIAAKDADDNMLWCWHIWMTDPPKTVGVYDRREDHWNAVMDRNVGATGAKLSEDNIFGLYYYNRSNHPFIGPASLKNSNLAQGTVEWAEFYKENPTYGSDAEYYNRRSVDPCPAGWEVMTEGTVDWLMGLGLSGASQGGFDLNATDFDFADPYVYESLLFPYGGIRKGDGSYSYVNTRSYMILLSNYVYSYTAGWCWDGPSPWSADTDYGYVRCMKE